MHNLNDERRPAAPHPADLKVSALIVECGRGEDGLIRRMVRRKGTTLDQAKDLFQDASLRFVLHVRKNGFPNSARAWMWRVMLNRFIDEYRRRKVLPVLVGEAEFDFGAIPDGMENAPQLQVVLDCVETRLNVFRRSGKAGERIVRTLLAHAEGATMREIRKMNEHDSEQAAAVFLHHCRRELKPVLAPCTELMKLVLRKMVRNT